MAAKRKKVSSKKTGKLKENAVRYRAGSRLPNKEFKFIDLFCGIGGFRIAFEKKGGDCVFSSDYDKFSQETYEANYGEKPHGDISKVMQPSTKLREMDSDSVSLQRMIPRDH